MKIPVGIVSFEVSWFELVSAVVNCFLLPSDSQGLLLEASSLSTRLCFIPMDVEEVSDVVGTYQTTKLRESTTG
jgi:hypothetical protein